MFDECNNNYSARDSVSTMTVTMTALKSDKLNSSLLILYNLQWAFINGNILLITHVVILLVHHQTNSHSFRTDWFGI